jgi:transcriptional regulator with XRE-family HTH domain
MDKTVTVGQVFARRLSEIRQARGWSQQRLADELEAVGVTMDRAAIAKIERGRDAHQRDRARRVSIEELFAFAVALGVSPLTLLLGIEDTTNVAVSRDVVLPAVFVTPWLVGQLPLRPEDVPFYSNESPLLDVAAFLDNLLEEISRTGELPKSPVIREALRANVNTGLRTLAQMLEHGRRLTPEMTAELQAELKFLTDLERKLEQKPTGTKGAPSGKRGRKTN